MIYDFLEEFWNDEKNVWKEFSYLIISKMLDDWITINNNKSEFIIIKIKRLKVGIKSRYVIHPAGQL